MQCILIALLYQAKQRTESEGLSPPDVRFWKLLAVHEGTASRPALVSWWEALQCPLCPSCAGHHWDAGPWEPIEGGCLLPCMGGWTGRAPGGVGWDGAVAGWGWGLAPGQWGGWQVAGWGEGGSWGTKGLWRGPGFGGLGETSGKARLGWVFWIWLWFICGFILLKARVTFTSEAALVFGPVNCSCFHS